MSVFVMSLVWKRYPVGGGDMLLALAMADHASDDGTKVYPSIKHLAQKTRQSERTVQYQLRRMEELRWLILVNAGNGGRNVCREYRINEDWINGADIAPLPNKPTETPPNAKGADIAPPQKGASGDVKGASDNTKGATDDTKGAAAIAPASNHQEPPVNVSKPLPAARPPAKSGKAAPAAPVVVLPDWIPENVWQDWVEHRVAVKAPLTQRAAELCIGKLEKMRVAGQDPVAVINQSIMSGKWTDFYDVKTPQQPGIAPQGRPAKFDPSAYVNSGASNAANRTVPPAPRRANGGDIIDM